MGVLSYLLHLVLPGVVAAPHLPHTPLTAPMQRRGTEGEGKINIEINEEDKKDIRHEILISYERF
jgi:hypothetical protein